MDSLEQEDDFYNFDILEQNINKPLSVKIPISLDYYELLKSQKNMVTFDKTKTCNLSIMIENAIEPKNFDFRETGENGFVSSYNFLFQYPLEYLNSNDDGLLEFGRNNSQFICWSTEFLVFLTIEKYETKDFNNAKKEIIDKLESLDEIFWADEKIGDLPFIFFAVVAGKKAQLYAINRNKQVKKLTKEYDLEEGDDRINLVLNMINIYRIVSKFSTYIIFYKAFSWQEKLNGIKCYYDSNFIREIIKFDDKNKDREVLESIYKSMSEGKIPNTMKCKFKSTEDSIDLKLYPYCVNGYNHAKESSNKDEEFKKMIKSILKSLEALHHQGFVHRLVHWRNVVFNKKSNEYLLIGFESAGRSGAYLPDYLLNTSSYDIEYPMEIKTKSIGYSVHSDVYLVGVLINDLEYWIDPGNILVKIRKEIFSNYNTITAKMILDQLV